MYKYVLFIYTPYLLCLLCISLIKKKKKNSKLNIFYIVHIAWKNLKLPFLQKKLIIYNSDKN